MRLSASDRDTMLRRAGWRFTCVFFRHPRWVNVGTAVTAIRWGRA